MSYWMPSRKRLKPFDTMLLGTIAAILLFGLVMVHSSSSYFAIRRYDTQFYFLFKQIGFVGIGTVAMLGLAYFDYNKYRKLVYPMLLILAILLIAVLFTDGIKGASRWIKIGGFGLQPSEFAKLVLVIYMAHSLSRPGRKMDTFLSGFLNHLFVPMLIIGLIFIEPDFGTSFLIFILIMTMLFVGGSRMRYLIGTALVAAPAITLAIVLFPYRLKRVKHFLDSMTLWGPDMDYTLMSYHIRESMISIGSGGFNGWGLGNGPMKMYFLPEAHTDFIFSTLAQELGFVGSLALFLAFTILIIQGYRIAINCKDVFGTYLAFGITTLLAFQFLINMGGVTGLLPPKGITLPLISYGGSSLIVCMASLGILINVQRQSADGRNSWGSQ